jgi:hypothetical protein
MSTATALQVIDTHPIAERQSWELMRDKAAILIKSGFLPEAIRTPEQALAVMMKGSELRIPAMYALSNIAIVKGKPTCSAELMLALVRRDHGSQAIRIRETTAQRCVVEWRTPGWPGTSEYAYTIEDATRAGLAAGETWRKYPAAMLRARCISAVVRMAFPECIGGMYGPGELGEAVVVTDDGEVVSGAAATSPADTDVHDVDAIEGEVVADASESPPPDEPPPPVVAPAQRRREGRERANARYHAICTERGLSDAADKALALSLFPTRPNGRGVKETASRTELTEAELDDAATLVEETFPPLDRDADNKLLPETIHPLVEYANRVAAAPDQKTLAGIAAEMRAAGVTGDLLRRLWHWCNRRVPPVAVTEPEETSPAMLPEADEAARRRHLAEHYAS